MKLVKTKYLSGKALDWVVARIEGVEYSDVTTYNGIGQEFPPTHYSTNWDLAGPIIEREHIDIRHTFTRGRYRTSESTDAVNASIYLPNGSTQFEPSEVVHEYGETPIIAALRCFVASILGDEVEVPEELLST